MKWSVPVVLVALCLASPASAQPKPKPPARPKAPSAQAQSSSGKSFSFSFSTSRGRLGVNATSMTDELRDYFGAPHGSGVLVQRVSPGTPAAKAGVKVGDVITKIDGKAIEDTPDVLDALSGKKKGDGVTLGVVRGRRALQLSTKLDTDPPEDDGFDFDIDGLGDLFKGFGPQGGGGTWFKQWSFRWPPNGSSSGSANGGSSSSPSFEQRLKDLRKRMQGLQQQ
jgi:membrane-associated protease RseP (regulator of RpoE activity)